MNLGVLRNAFLGKALCKMLSEKYEMNIQSATMICDVGNLAEIMYYASYCYQGEKNFKKKYFNYMNNLFKHGFTSVNKDSDPQSEQVCKFSQNISNEYRKNIREQYKDFFVAEVAKIKIFFNEINFQSDYSDYQCETYLDRDVNFILQKRQQGISHFCFVIGVDQGAHFFELKKRIKTLCPDVGIYTIMHEFVRIKDKQKGIDDLVQNLQESMNDKEVLSDIQLYYLSHPLNKSFCVSEEVIKKSKIGTMIKNFYKYKPTNTKQSFQSKKEVYLATMVMDHSIDTGINKLSPDFLVKRLGNYLKLLGTYELEYSEWQYCKKIVNKTVDILGLEYLKENSHLNVLHRKLNNEENR